MPRESFWKASVVLTLCATLLACSSTTDPTANLSGDIDDGPEVDETADEMAEPAYTGMSLTAVCPSGSAYDDGIGLCVAGDRAFGPFTDAMIAACKAQSGEGCDNATWPITQAFKLRGNDICPTGAKIDQTLGVCVEGTKAIGPFDDSLVEDCEKRGGGTACLSLRWDKALVSPMNVVNPTGDESTTTQSLDFLDTNCSAFNQKLFNYYSTRRGFQEVSRLGVRTLGTTRNGCATWLSHAIRQTGVNMPVETNTEGFRDALKARGWREIRDRNALLPGDVIITKDRKGRPGHPDHVYMFAGWQDAGKTTPLAVDNQGFTHPRGPNKAKIAYGLRAPSNSNNCNGTPSTSTPNPAVNETRDSCSGKGDGWYCSELRDFSAYKCGGGQISGGWQCSGRTVCRTTGGKASLVNGNPGCYGK